MKQKKKKTKKIKSSNLKRKSKSKIQVLSDKEVSTIENLGIDLGAGLSKKELAAIKKAGIDLRADAEKYPFKEEIVKVNVFDEAGKVKNFLQLENFLDKFAPGIDATLAARVLAKYARDNWNSIKILNDPENHGAVLELLERISLSDRGARQVWLEYNLNTKNKEKIEEDDGALAKFILATGYHVPKTDKTFQEHISVFKNHFGLKRKKKKVPHFRDVEFSI